MRITLILISLLISIQSVSVQASDIIDVKQLSPALNWKQARTECTNLGDTWDLPTVEQALSDEFESKLVNPLKVRDLKSQRIKTYFLVWVKSDQEELNQQLVEVSQALKIDYESKDIDSYPMSAPRLQVLNKYLSDLVENKDSIARTAKDHSKLLAFLETYHSTDFGSIYRIDQDLPMSEQAEYVLMLPTNILPYDIFLILNKPSARYVQTQIDNMEFEVNSISGGIEVVCVQTESF